MDLGDSQTPTPAKHNYKPGMPSPLQQKPLVSSPVVMPCRESTAIDGGTDIDDICPAPPSPKAQGSVEYVDLTHLHMDSDEMEVDAPGSSSSANNIEPTLTANGHSPSSFATRALKRRNEPAPAPAPPNAATSVVLEASSVIILRTQAMPHLAFKVPNVVLSDRTPAAELVLPWVRRKRGEANFQHKLFKEAQHNTMLDEKYRKSFNFPYDGGRGNDPPLFRLARPVARMESIDKYYEEPGAEYSREIMPPQEAEHTASELCKEYGLVTVSEYVPPLPVWLLQGFELGFRAHNVVFRIMFGRDAPTTSFDDRIELHRRTDKSCRSTLVIDLDITWYERIRIETTAHATKHGYDSLPDAAVVSYEMGRTLAAIHSTGLDARSVDFILAGAPLVPDRTRQRKTVPPLAPQPPYTYPIMNEINASSDPATALAAANPPGAFCFGPRFDHPPTRRGQPPSKYWDPRCEDAPIDAKGGWAFWVMNLGKCERLPGSMMSSLANKSRYRDTFFEHADGSENFSYPRIRHEAIKGPKGHAIRVKRREHGRMQGICADYFETGYCDGSQEVEPHLSVYFPWIKDEMKRRDELEDCKEELQPVKPIKSTIIEDSMKPVLADGAKVLSTANGGNKLAKSVDLTKDDGEDDEGPISPSERRRDARNARATDDKTNAIDWQSDSKRTDRVIDRIRTDNVPPPAAANKREDKFPSATSNKFVPPPATSAHKTSNHDVFAKQRDKMTAIREQAERTKTETSKSAPEHDRVDGVDKPKENVGAKRDTQAAQAAGAPSAAQQVLNLLSQHQSAEKQQDSELQAMEDAELQEAINASMSNAAQNVSAPQPKDEAETLDDTEMQNAIDACVTGDFNADMAEGGYEDDSSTFTGFSSSDGGVDVAVPEEVKATASADHLASDDNSEDIQTLITLVRSIDLGGPNIKRKMRGYPAYENAVFFIGAQKAREIEGVVTSASTVGRMVRDLRRAMEAARERR